MSLAIEICLWVVVWLGCSFLAALVVGRCIRAVNEEDDYYD